MVDKSDSRYYLAVSGLLLSILCVSTMGKIIYVDDDAAGANDGSSWENAYIYLQDALADANSAEKPVEIRIAQGTYRPNQGFVAIPEYARLEFNWRTVTFQLIDGVSLLGGFAGFGEPDPNDRNVQAYKTILSGDLNGDDIEVADPCDLLDEPTRAENSHRVVTGSGTNATAVLDGFTIRDGNANGLYSGRKYIQGAGMYNHCSNPTLINRTFCSPTVTNCTFYRNSSFGAGGGMYNQYSETTVTNCVFIENYGGGMYNTQCEPIVSYCTFIGNLAGTGGGLEYHGSGMYNRSSTVIIGNCQFIENSARDGGGVRLDTYYINITLTNCIFSKNTASYSGGGIYNVSGNVTVTNCTFIANSAEKGCALFSYSTYFDPETFLISKVELTNCILTDGGQEVWNSGDGSSVIRIAYSNILGGKTTVEDSERAIIWGAGNIDFDPLFANPGYWTDVNDPNIVVEPNDPNAVWINGDYHLKSKAGRWDPTSKSWIIDDVTSPCIDAGNPMSSVEDEPEPDGGIINMGAYGGSSQASKSPSEINAKYGGGTGESNDPYLIYTAEQMNTIGAEPNEWGKHFKLMADIDLKDFGGSSFNLIGSYSQPFKGVFDGNGHAISNLTYIISGDEEPADGSIMRFGLFRHIDDPNTVIKDLRLVNPVLQPASTCQKRLDYVGALVGSLGSGSIRNCSIEGGQVQGEWVVGGLAGWNKGTISDCYTTCAVEPAEERLMPPINEQFDRREYFGGLVGYNSSYGEINNCHATGKVSGEENIGGLVGETDGVISNSRSSGDVSGDASVGGLVGWSVGKSRLSHCYAAGHVSGQRRVGGLVGFCSKNSSIDSCHVTGCVTAEQEAGGLVGLHEGTISECSSISPVSAASDMAGGLVGFNGGTIFTSWAYGDISGKSNIGGLVGENKKWSQLIAGILFEYDGIVVDSYAKGGVHGENGVGGLIGDNTGTVLRCYSIGRITGKQNFGGLIGINGEILAMDSFWDTEMSGLNTSAGGTGKTTAEMQTAGTFHDAGWDFDHIWVISEGEYPKLRWEVIEDEAVATP
jgi:hypothetical protein